LGSVLLGCAIVLPIPPPSFPHLPHHLLDFLGYGLTQHRIIDELLDYRLARSFLGWARMKLESESSVVGSEALIDSVVLAE
jgi:hypothetical protein